MSFCSSLATIISDAMSLTVLLSLLICAVTIAFNLLVLEFVETIDFELFASVHNLLAIVALNFICCYLSEQITEALGNIGDSFYESAWHDLPPHQQKLTALTMLRSQREFRLTGLGLISCSLDTFVRVINVSSSSDVFFLNNFKFVHLADSKSRCLILLDD